MRSVMVLAFILFCKGMSDHCSASSFFKYIDVFTGFELTIPLDAVFSEEDFVPYAERDDTIEQQSPMSSILLKPCASCKIICSNCTAFGSILLKDTSLSSIKQFFKNLPDSQPPLYSLNWGLSLHLGRSTSIYEADLLAGTLHFSQGISRLKDPRLSTGSALSRLGQDQDGIGAVLPSRSSSESAPAFAVQLTPGLQNESFPSVQAAYVSSGDCYISAGTCLVGVNSSRISFSATAGLFYYEGEGPDSWFSKSPRFSKDRYPAAEASVSVILPLLRSKTAFGVGKQPTGGASSWFKTQDAVLLGPFYLGAAFFASDSAYISSDGTALGTPFQCSINPQYTFAVLHHPLRAGLLGAVDFRTSAYHSSDLAPLYKLRLALDYRLPCTTLSATAGFSYTDEDSQSTYTTGASATHLFSKIKSSFSFDTSFTKGKAAYEGNISFTGIHTNAFAAVISGAVSTKDGSFANGRSSAGITFRGSSKHLKWTGKTVFLFTF